jgi:hypothetical protein
MNDREQTLGVTSAVSNVFALYAGISNAADSLSCWILGFCHYPLNSESGSIKGSNPADALLLTGPQAPWSISAIHRGVVRTRFRQSLLQ